MINWKVRIKNPVFWANIVIAIVAPILAGLGMQWENITTWGALGNILLKAISNPVIVVSVIVSIWGVINDPTTKGIKDSKQALTYDKPKGE